MCMLAWLGGWVGKSWHGLVGGRGVNLGMAWWGGGG